jgi:hypothetical protein
LLESAGNPSEDRSKELGIIVSLCVVGIVSRVIAIHASLWEWDDILFAHAMHEYDLERNIPHPPGFPVFIMLGRLAYAFFKNEHHALVAVNIVFASLLAPALYFLFREIFKDRWIALTGALFSIFAANVWLHSGGPRSDIPGFAIGVICLALAIRGMRSSRALLLSCALLGLGMGVRVTVLPAAAPTVACVLLFHLWKRNWRLVAGAVSTATVCFLIWFVPLIMHTSWRLYQFVMSKHSEFTLAKDSIFSDTENGVLSYRMRRFFLDIWGARSIAWSMLGLSAVGLGALAATRRFTAIGWMVIAFVPYLVFVFVLNTPLSAPLYSLPYIPFFAGLAACGAILAPQLGFRYLKFPQRVGRPGLIQTIAAAFIPGLILIWMVVWTYPVIRMVRSEESPPLRAIEHLKKRLNPQSDVLVYDGLFSPYIRFLLPGQLRAFQTEDAYDSRSNLIDPLAGNPSIYGLASPWPTSSVETAFRWSQATPARRLRMISLGRYFDVYVSDLSKRQRTTYLSGWYSEESDGQQSWRWMGRHGRIGLLNSGSEMFLRLRAATPRPPNIKQLPTVRISIDSRQIAEMTAPADLIDQTWSLHPDTARLWSVLSIETDQSFSPRSIGASSDDRDLGIQSFGIDWYPAPGTESLIASNDQFLGPGWYRLERDATRSWRWTSDRAIVYLPPLDGDGQLILTMFVPERSSGIRSDVTLTIAGEKLDQFNPPAGFFTRKYRIPARLIKHRAELQLSTVGVVTPPDTRTLGIRVFEIDWKPAP